MTRSGKRKLTGSFYKCCMHTPNSTVYSLHMLSSRNVNIQGQSKTVVVVSVGGRTQSSDVMKINSLQLLLLLTITASLLLGQARLSLINNIGRR